MNPSRKMCTMRKVDKVTPIEGADRIECAHVGGWTCVVGKGEFQPGEYAVYFEPDTSMPTNDPRYSHMAQWGEKTMTINGVPTVVHVLKVRRLRGVYSQGYLAKPHDIFPSVPEHAYQEMYEKRARLDGLANVCEYVPESNSVSAGFIGKYDPYVAPRTDAERIQNIDDDVFELVKRTNYFASVKVDGTSTTICYDPRVNRVRCFSHNNEYDLETGLGKTTADAAKRQGIWQWCEEHPGITIQAELCGSKIQNNRLKLKEHTLFVFSMWDMEKRCYLDPRIAPGIADRCVPDYHVDITDMTRDELIERIDGIKGNITPGCLDEGIVIHVMYKGELSDEEWDVVRNALGQTLQMKVVSNKFLLKA